MIQTGALLARQIDALAAKLTPGYEKGRLTRIVEEGNGHIGRMLHYFPFEEKVAGCEDDWCGWHNDHGSLTALTSALFTDAAGEEYTLKTNTGGIYAQNRFSEMAQIRIPKDMLAFQLGESTQIHTGGQLEATPHCVVRSEELAGRKIARNTFALFMQPRFLEKMDTPPGTESARVLDTKAHKVPPLKDRWENGILFKDFHSRTLKHYS